MRRRLIIVLLVLAVAAVAGFALPLLDSAAQERTQRLLIDRTAAVNRFALLAQQAITARDTDGLAAEVRAYTALYGEDVLVLDRGRQVMARAGDLDPEDPAVRPLVDGALRNEAGQPLPTLRPWTRTTSVLTRPVGTGTRISGVVLLRVDPVPAATELARSWTVIGIGALLAAAVSALLAFLLARWLLRPLAQLGRGVEEVAAGHSGAHVPVCGGPPELRTLTVSFNRMSDAVAKAAETERRLVADASHQLRTPIGVLRLLLDDLEDGLPATVDPSGSPYRPLSTEVDRLESLVSGLLALEAADRGHADSSSCSGRADEPDVDADEPCDPRAVADERVRALLAGAHRAGVRLRSELPDVLPETSCPSSELSQVLDVLLDNAIRYAGHGATVTVHGRERAGTVVLAVADDGPGLTADERGRATDRFWRAADRRSGGGTGLGLAIADRLVSARDGRLTLLPHPPTGLLVEVELPRRDPSERGGGPA